MRCLVAAAMLLTASVAAESQVRVWEEDVVIPTYPIGPDDVNPHFYELEGSVIYPYTMQDNLTTEKLDRTYRGWFLENEYLKLMALPDIGGRIQYVIDKRKGEPMFYHNRVIRPGLIALRGAWVSGGIEWNRGPTGHTVTSFSPVDVVGVANPDGSATLVIGNTEMNFRTGWEVRLTLHPGRAISMWVVPPNRDKRVRSIGREPLSKLSVVRVPRALRGRSALRTCLSPTSRRDSSPSVTSCWFADAVRLRHNEVIPC